MKITKGYIAMKADGTPLSMGIQNRWGTESAWMLEVADIEQATVLAHPTIRCALGRLDPDYPHPYSFVPVEVRREVVLMGFGVPHE